MKIKYAFLIMVFFVGLLATGARAATVTLTADKQTAGIGDTVNVTLFIDTQGTNVNAAQGIVHFSPGVLQLSSVDRSGSAFNFWVEDPNISNNVGTMSFTGGTTAGVSGSSLNILTMKFNVTGAGSSDITFTDAAVAANDGLGTNVLKSVIPVNVVISGGVVAGTAIIPAATTTTPVLPQPIARPAAPAVGLPVRPTIEISSYPDETRWYSQIGDVVVFWNVPRDITAVAVSVDKNPNGIPQTYDKQLFDGKDLGQLKQGTWYVHVRFRNNVGAGPVATHKISIDTVSPLQFTVSSSAGAESDDPSPTLNFETSDGLSGIDHYSVIIDNQQPIINDVGSLKLSPLEPGDHLVRVVAYDKAGNTSEAMISLKILPIVSPTIDSVEQPIYSNTDQRLRVSGSGLPNGIVLLTVVRIKDNSIVAADAARVDGTGQYGFTFEERLGNGNYKIVARNQDDRGALSLPAEFSTLVVKNKPILIVGSFELGFGGVSILLLILLVGSFIAGYYFYKFGRERISRKIFMTKQDLLKVADLMRENLQNIRKANGADELGKSFALNNLEQNISKLEKYIKKEVESIEK